MVLCAFLWVLHAFLMVLHAYLMFFLVFLLFQCFYMRRAIVARLPPHPCPPTGMGWVVPQCPPTEGVVSVQVDAERSIAVVDG